MKTVPLNEMFVVQYGNKFDLNKMELLPKDEGGLNFVNRSSKNCGVSATVAPVAGQLPYDAGSITVSLGGSKLLSSFVQAEPFYTGQNVAVLIPKAPMSFAERVFVCLCIRHNRFRYTAFGREANRTLRTLPVPDRSSFPGWLNSDDLADLEHGFAEPLLSGPKLPLEPVRWKPFLLSNIFDIRKGKRVTKANMSFGLTPFISATDSNNGVRETISLPPSHPGNLITVSYNGSVAEAFYQPVPFWASDDINVLYPKFELDPAIALFVCAIIRREKYRYNYGRKWNLERMKESEVRLPATAEGEPDWAWMRRFMQTQRFSSQLEAKDQMVVA
jgi:hypothetical protein